LNRRTALIAGGAAVAAVAGAGGLTLAEMGTMQAYEDSVSASRASLTAAPDLIELIRFATLAANSHNTQPWRFRIRDTRIEITPDTSRRTPVVDPHDHHLFISLGCAAENLAIAGGARGRPVSTAFSGEQGGSISCDMGVGAPIESDLADAIPVRQSTRADYDGRAVDRAVISELVKTARMPGVEIAIVTERSALDRLRDLIIAANGAQMADPAFIGELKHWLRFNSGQALAERDGLFSACSGNPQLPSWIAGTVFDWFVTADSENARYRRQIDSSSGIAVFFAEQDDADHWVRVGRAFERFALKATALGIKTAHLNQPVEVAGFRADLASLAGKPGGLPFLAVRFGYGPVMPYSVRRALPDVLA
jgi:hypothetical protein